MPDSAGQREQQPGGGADDVLRHHDGDGAQPPVSAGDQPEEETACKLMSRSRVSACRRPGRTRRLGGQSSPAGRGLLGMPRSSDARRHLARL